MNPYSIRMFFTSILIFVVKKGEILRNLKIYSYFWACF